MLSDNANFRINNVNNAISLLIRVRIELHTSICFLVKILENVHVVLDKTEQDLVIYVHLFTRIS